MSTGIHLLFLLCGTGAMFGAEAGQLLFQDDFKGGLAEGWSWVRGDAAAWRTTKSGLEMRVRPGNLWGPANNVSNVLVRPAPEVSGGEIEAEVTIENHPTHQYEQVNLAWYYDDSHMVKLGLEQVDGQRCIVMGREEADRCRTLAKIPIDANLVRVRLRMAGHRIRGQYRIGESTQWIDAGAGDLPVPPRGAAKISLHCYQGPADVERWARFSEFRLVRLSE